VETAVLEPAGIRFTFGGRIGERLGANDEHWFKAAPGRSPALDPAINIFDPGPDHGYGYFIHRKFGDFTEANGAPVVGPHFDDGLAEPGKHSNVQSQCKPEHQGCCGFGWREECMGGEYGPYLVPEWFSTTPDGGFSIVYTLSTWAPYQAHLMRTILAWRNDSKPAPPQRKIPDLPAAHFVNPDFADGLNGWQGLGDPFVTFSRNGRSYVTTFTPAKGDAAMGALFQDFTVDASTKACGSSCTVGTAR
jgi:hypothetical protein